MITALLLLGLGLQGDTMVTMTEPAAPLKRLMPHLAETCHAPIKVSKAMENDVVCIAVHDVSATALLDNVASTTGGKWVVEKDGTYLEPDTAARAKLTLKGIEKRAARLQHDIGLTDVHASNQEPWTRFAGPESSKTVAIGKSLLFKLESAIGVRRLAALRPGERIVFSTSPTSLQESFGTEISALIDAFAAEHDQNEAELETERIKEYPNSKAGDPRIVGRFSKMDVVAECERSQESIGTPPISLRCVFYDQSGKALGGSRTTYGISVPDDIRILWATDTSPPPTKPEPPIRLSNNAQTLHSCLGTYARQQPTRVRTAALQLLLTPEKVDPLSYPGELLFAAAKSRNLQLIASLPDNFFGCFCLQSSLEIDTPGDVFELVDKVSYLTSVQKDKWLLISPSDFTEAPLARSKLAFLSRKFENKFEVTIADLMELAGNEFGFYDGNDLVENWLDAVSPFLEGIAADEDWAFLKACAASSGPCVQALLSGRPCTVGEFGLEAQPLLSALIFGGFREREQLISDRPDGLWGSTRYPADNGTEPTETLTHGLRPDSPANVQVDTEVVMRPAGEASYSAEQQWNMSGAAADEVGRMAATVEREPDIPFKVTSADFDHELSVFRTVQLGKRSTYKIRILATANAYHECKIVIPSFTSATTYTLKTLPEELRTQFETAASRAKAQARQDLEEYEKTRKTPPLFGVYADLPLMPGCYRMSFSTTGHLVK